MVLPGVDTIVAAATPRGVSALSVVRLSGGQALKIGSSVFTGTVALKEAITHTAHVGYVRTQEGSAIDQVVATVFIAPHSATGEDVVEFSCHGGSLAADLVLDRLIAAGARPAGPGEFTQRAFVNGKMDLAQAEAVADLIHARSTRAHRVSVEHLQGSYSRHLESLRSELLELVSLLELELDFSDEDVEFADRARLESLLDGALEWVGDLVDSFRYGRVLRDGIIVTIGGKPNAGKSTLLNALLGRDRVIVSDVPGTTRDEVESELEFDGWRLTFVDTAGIRETEDAIEAEGVRRARDRFERSDVVLYLVDAQLGPDEEDQEIIRALRESSADRQVYLVASKLDLVDSCTFSADLLISAPALESDRLAAEVVLKSITGFLSSSGNASEEHRIVTSERHRTHIRNVQKALQRAGIGLKSGVTADLISSDLKIGMEEIGMITGQITNEDVLDQIFSRFCIGK